MAYQQPTKGYEQSTPAYSYTPPTCLTCNHNGHTSASCFLTHPNLLSSFLKMKPEKSAYWEKRVEDYRAFLNRVARRQARADREMLSSERKAAHEAKVAEDRRLATERKAQRKKESEERKAQYESYVATQQCYSCNEYGHFSRDCITEIPEPEIIYGTDRTHYYHN